MHILLVFVHELQGPNYNDYNDIFSFFVLYLHIYKFSVINFRKYYIHSSCYVRFNRCILHKLILNT